MKHLTIKQTMGAFTNGERLTFADAKSIEPRDLATKEYRKFKRSGLTESQYYWKKELEWWGVN